MKHRNQSHPRARSYWLKRAILWILTGWSLLLAYRLGFAWFFCDSGQGRDLAGPVIVALLAGLRFDLATLPLLIAPALLLEPFCASAPRVRRFLLGLQGTALAAAALTLSAGLLQFRFNQKLPGPEFLTYFHDGPQILLGLLRTDATLVCVTLLPGLLVLGTAYFVLRERAQAANARVPETLRLNPLPLYLSRLAILLAATLALRGGWQASPLRPADALGRHGACVDQLPLNAIFTLYHAARETDDFPRFFDRAANVRNVQALYDRPALSNEYPLLARMPARTHPILAARAPRQSDTAVFRPHIVVVLLESFSASFLRESHGGRALTPGFNSVARGGLSFSRFFAAGGRSANALFSLLTGIPDRAGRTILRSPGIENRFGALPRLLQPAGYRSLFLHPGDLRFDSLDRVTGRFGFDATLGPAELGGTGDARLYRGALAELDRATARGPTFALLFTVDTHHPYRQGPEQARILPGRNPGERLRNAVHFADRNLADFMAAARKRAWFERTIFVLTADHTHHAGLAFLDDLHLPLVFFAPALLDGGRSDRVGTHLDLHATLLALAGGGRFAALGRDLLAAEDPVRGGFFAGGSRTDVIGWIGEERLCFVWPAFPPAGDAAAQGTERLGRSALYSSRFPVDAFQLNFVEPERLADCGDRARHVYQLARDLERANRVWPPETGRQP